MQYYLKVFICAPWNTKLTCSVPVDATVAQRFARKCEHSNRTQISLPLCGFRTHHGSQSALECIYIFSVIRKAWFLQNLAQIIELAPLQQLKGHLLYLSQWHLWVDLMAQLERQMLKNLIETEYMYPGTNYLVGGVGTLLENLLYITGWERGLTS